MTPSDAPGTPERHQWTGRVVRKALQLQLGGAGWGGASSSPWTSGRADEAARCSSVIQEPLCGDAQCRENPFGRTFALDFADNWQRRKLIRRLRELSDALPPRIMAAKKIQAR